MNITAPSGIIGDNSDLSVYTNDIYNTTISSASPFVPTSTPQQSHVAPLYSYNLYFAYVVPQIQIPFELAITHLCFLTVLDKQKNVIGRVQHMWLTYICKILGLSHFILPHTASRATGEESALRRPPPGWDSRVLRPTSRWAWGGEEKSAVERGVLERRIPSFWLIRLLALCLITWLLLTTMILCVAFVPMLTGRFVFLIVQLPLWMVHDPACFIIGAAVNYYVVRSLSKLLSRPMSYYIAGCASMPVAVVGVLIKLTAAWLTIVFFIGILIQFVQYLASLSSPMPFYALGILGCYIKGSVVVNLAVGCVYSGYLEKFLRLCLITPAVMATAPDATEPNPHERMILEAIEVRAAYIYCLTMCYLYA